MADQKITDLAALATPTATDLFTAVDDVGGSPVNKKIAFSDLQDSILSDDKFGPTVIVAKDASGHYTDIQDAIDALPAGGGQVLIKGGQYELAASLSIAKSNVSLVGIGEASEIIAASGLDDNLIDLGDGADPYSNFRIAGLKLSGDRDNQSAGHGIALLSGVSDVFVADCLFDDIYNSKIYDENGASRVRIAGCKFLKTGDYDIFSAGGLYWKILDNDFPFDTSDPTSRIYLNAAGSFLIQGNEVVGKGDSNAGDFAYITNCTLGRVLGNSVRGTKNGIYIYTGNTGLVVTGNTFGHYTTKIYADGIYCASSRTVISGNFVYLAGAHGIDLQSVMLTKVLGNLVSSSVESGIFVGASSTNGIGGNIVEDSEQHGIYLYGSCLRNILEGNHCINNGQETDDTYSEIHLAGGGISFPKYNDIKDNLCFDENANKCAYSICEASSSCDYNNFWNNHVKGAKTDDILIQGANSDASENKID